MDSSVTVAAVVGEDRCPAPEFWTARVVASRLTDFETRVRAARHGAAAEIEQPLNTVLSHISFVEIDGKTMDLIYREVPRNLRTLDAIHLATLEYFNREIGETQLATYDRRLAAAAQAMGFEVLAP